MNELEKGTPMGRGSQISWQVEGGLGSILTRHKATHLDGHLQICRTLVLPSSPPLYEKGRADILTVQLRKWHRTVRLMHEGVTANE